MGFLIKNETKYDDDGDIKIHTSYFNDFLSGLAAPVWDKRSNAKEFNTRSEAEDVMRKIHIRSSRKLTIIKK